MICKRMVVCGSSSVYGPSDKGTTFFHKKFILFLIKLTWRKTQVSKNVASPVNFNNLKWSCYSTILKKMSFVSVYALSEESTRLGIFIFCQRKATDRKMVASNRKLREMPPTDGLRMSGPTAKNGPGHGL